MSDNIFENFSFTYLDNINGLTKDDIYSINSCRVATNIGIFSKPKYIHLKDEESLKNIYGYIESLNGNISLKDWILTAKTFAEFLFTAEKCFMFKNCEDNPRVYAEAINDDNITIVFKPKDLDTDIEITFEDTELNIINHHSSILDFMNDDTDDPDTVLFVNIAIKRKFGKQNISRFNLVYGSDPTFDDNTDEVLFNSIKTIVGEMIFHTFNYIIDNCLMNVSKNHIQIRVEDAVNGIRIR